MISIIFTLDGRDDYHYKYVIKSGLAARNGETEDETDN